MLRRLVLPWLDNCLVVAEKAEAFAGPLVAPGEGGGQDGKELLPLDGHFQLVGLPRVVKPAALEIGPTAQSARCVGVQVDTVSWDAAGVNEVGRAVPCGEEVDPPGEVCPGLPAEADPVV